MRNSSGLYNSNSHSQVLDTHTRTHIVKNMPWRLGLGWGWSHQRTCKSLDTIHTHKHTHTRNSHPHLPAPHTGSIPSTKWLQRQGCYGFTVGRRTAGNVGRASWNTWQGKKTLGKECCIDRKVWRGNSRYARVLKTEATVVNWYYHLWLKVGVFD